MSKKVNKIVKKNEIPDLDHVELTSEESESQEPKIPFAQWFNKKLLAGRVRSHQDEALLVFFKKQGLKNIEDEDVYNRAFERF